MTSPICCCRKKWRPQFFSAVLFVVSENSVMSFPMFILNFKRNRIASSYHKYACVKLNKYIHFGIYMYFFGLMIYHLCLCVPLCGVEISCCFSRMGKLLGPQRVALRRQSIGHADWKKLPWTEHLCYLFTRSWEIG